MSDLCALCLSLSASVFVGQVNLHIVTCNTWSPCNTAPYSGHFGYNSSIVAKPQCQTESNPATLFSCCVTLKVFPRGTPARSNGPADVLMQTQQTCSHHSTLEMASHTFSSWHECVMSPVMKCTKNGCKCVCVCV